MICPHCNAKWQEEMNMTRLATCPFCQKSLIQDLGTIMIQDFSLALASIALENGTEFLINKPAATLAILADCTTALERERKMLQRFYESKIHELFREVPEVSEYLMNKAVRLLSEESLMSRESSEYIIREFIKGLGLELLAPAEVEKAETAKEATVKKDGAAPKEQYVKVNKEIPIEDRGIAKDAGSKVIKAEAKDLAEWNQGVNEQLLRKRLPTVVKRADIKLVFGSQISEKDLKAFSKAFSKDWNYNFNHHKILAIAYYRDGLLGMGTNGIIFSDIGIITMFRGYKDVIRYEYMADIKSYVDAGVKGIKILDQQNRVRVPGITSRGFDVDAMVSLLKELAGI